MSDNIQLASMLLGTRDMSQEPVSMRRETPIRSSRASEGQPVQNDTDNTARDFSDERKKTSFDKVLHQRMERKPDDTSDSADTTDSTEQPAAAQLNPDSELTLATLMAQFSRGFETTSADHSSQSAQKGNPRDVAMSVKAQSPSAAIQTTQVSIPAPQTDGSAGEKTAQVTGKTPFPESFAPREQASVTQTAPAAPVPAGEIKPSAEKQAVPETGDRPQPSVGAATEKTASVPQAVDPAEGTKQPALQGSKDISVSEVGIDEPDLETVSAKALQAKDNEKPDPSATVASGSTMQANTSEPSTASTTHGTADAAVVQESVQNKSQMTGAPEKGTLNVTESAEVSKIRASDPVAASRTVDQIAQKLSLEQPIRVDQQIRLTLSPQELGTVRITFREQNGEIVGLLEAQKPQTRKELDDSMPQLLSSMQGQGVQIRRIEVVQWNAPQQQSRDSLSDGFNPSAEREFLQQRPGQSGDGSSNQRGFSQSDGFSAGAGKNASAQTVDTKEWFSDKGLNLYI
jgi:flagellar hook-length control protein FliK